MHLPLFLAGIGGDAILSMQGSRSKEPHGLVGDGKCVATPVGDRNPIGNGSVTIGARKSTVMAGESGTDCVHAGENAASVRTAPSEADSHPPTRAEVWRVPTWNNTSQQAILLEAISRFFEVETD
jgi:hypothetical protein